MHLSDLPIAAALFAAGTIRLRRRPRANVSADELKKIEAALPAAAPAKPAKPRKILVFDRTEGFHHDSIPVGDKAFELMGKKTGALYRDGVPRHGVFTPENLAKYDAVLFNNTTQLKFNDPKQREALLRLHPRRQGIHRHPRRQRQLPHLARGRGDDRRAIQRPSLGSGRRDGRWQDRTTTGPCVEPLVRRQGIHPQGRDLPDQGPLFPRHASRALESRHVEGSQPRGPQEEEREAQPPAAAPTATTPIAWIKRYGDGRVFYCSLGHNKEIYWNKAVLQHYLAGIQWALGDLKADDTPTREVGQAAGTGPGPEVKPSRKDRLPCVRP